MEMTDSAGRILFIVGSHIAGFQNGPQALPTIPGGHGIGRQHYSLVEQYLSCISPSQRHTKKETFCKVHFLMVDGLYDQIHPSNDLLLASDHQVQG
jgi:hypothetical protein